MPRASAESEFEFATKAPGRFRAWMRQGPVEALSISDGAATWKALPKAKQWSKIQTAALEDDDDEPPRRPAASPRTCTPASGATSSAATSLSPATPRNPNT